MGIEGGSIGSLSVGPSIGTSISGISSGIEGGFGARGGPSLGGIRGGITDLEASVPLGRIGFSIVNEGPVRGSLEGFRPMNASDIHTIDKGGTIAPNIPSVLEQAEAVAAKAWEVSALPASPRLASSLARGEPTPAQVVSQAEVIISQAAVIPDVIPWMPGHFTQPELVVRSGQIELPKIASQKAVLTEVNKKIVQENPVGQSLEGEMLVEDKVVEQPKASEVGEIEELRLKDLLDEEVAQQRVYEIGKAIDLAKAEADKEGVDEIEGWRIVKFLSPEHVGNRSQIVKERGPDGSLSETLEELAARKFSSKSQAKEQSSEIVARKEPVRRGKEGKIVTEGAVERVFKHHFVKRSPLEEVARRVKRKQERQTGEKIESLGVKETRIEDYPDLAEVFKTAA